MSPANNQDNHKKQWGTENPRRTVILANFLSEANIYDAAKNNRTYATEDYDFKLKYTLDNYLMGSKVNINSVGNTVKINVNMTDPSDSTIGTVEVVVNGGKTIATSKASGQTANLEFTVPTDYSYYYVRIMQPDGDRIVSAPVQPTATVQPAVTSNTNNTITYSNTNNNTSTTNNSSNTTYTTTNSNNTTCTTNNNTCTTTDTNNAEITEDTYNGTQEQMDSSVVVLEITSTTDTTVQTNSTSQLDTSPKTGDEQGLQIWFIIMIASLAMTLIGGIALYKNH